MTMYGKSQQCRNDKYLLIGKSKDSNKMWEGKKNKIKERQMKLGWQRHGGRSSERIQNVMVFPGKYADYTL